MARVNTFALDAHVCPVLIHHFTSSGKVAGSPAVVDAVRIALTVREEKDHPGVRVLSTYAANVADGVPVRYTVTGGATAPYAVWLDDSSPEVPADGPQAAREPVRPAAQAQHGSRCGIAPRRRPASGCATAAGQRPAQAPAAPAGGPGWRVIRRAMDATDSPGPPAYVGTSYPGPDAAQAAAQADAGNGPLSWRTDDQGRHVASVPDQTGQGRHRVYVAYLADA